MPYVIYLSQFSRNKSAQWQYVCICLYQCNKPDVSTYHDWKYCAPPLIDICYTDGLFCNCSAPTILNYSRNDIVCYLYDIIVESYILKIFSTQYKHYIYTLIIAYPVAFQVASQARSLLCQISKGHPSMTWLMANLTARIDFVSGLKWYQTVFLHYRQWKGGLQIHHFTSSFGAVTTDCIFIAEWGWELFTNYFDICPGLLFTDFDDVNSVQCTCVFIRLQVYS